MGEVAAAQTAQMGKIVSKTANPKKREGFGRESHKKRVLNALPPVGAVNMSHGATEWHPVCVIRTGTKNVAMQSTTDNFTKLFEIVRKCLAGLKETGAHTPVRKLRRTKSNPLAPKGPPGERLYFCKSKNIWITKTTIAEDTTPRGRGKGKKAGSNRRFRKSPTANPPKGRIGLRPGVLYERGRLTPEASRGQRVLADNDDKDDDDDKEDDDARRTTTAVLLMICLMRESA